MTKSDEHMPCTTCFNGIAAHYKWVSDELDGKPILYGLHWALGDNIEKLEDFYDECAAFAGDKTDILLTGLQDAPVEGVLTAMFTLLVPPPLFVPASVFLIKSGRLDPADAEGLEVQKNALLNGPHTLTLRVQ